MHPPPLRPTLSCLTFPPWLLYTQPQARPSLACNPPCHWVSQPGQFGIYQALEFRHHFSRQTMFQCRQGHGQLDSVRSSSSRHKQWTQGQQQAVHKAAVGAQMEARQGEEGVGHHARGHPVTAPEGKP
mmetsp:Transcript_28906/g.77878  ORF Transcript_28906/g.77878 Transcript_28906/m.77878 type:complete len:128 (-) Transcript_28906:422-805(-)